MFFKKFRHFAIVLSTIICGVYLKEHYFDHPYYLKIDGKPVIFVYLTREYFRNIRTRRPEGDEREISGYLSRW
jgi:hypothetical protein